MRYKEMEYKTIHKINEIEKNIENGELEEAKTKLSSLEETVIKDPKNKNLIRTISAYKCRIEKKEAEYVK